MLGRKETREKLQQFMEKINLASHDGVQGKSKSAKIEQVVGYLELVRAQLKRYSRRREMVLVECAAGNCYLSFLVYYYFTELEKRPVAVHCIDINKRLMVKARYLAESLGMNRMFFHGKNISSFRIDGSVDLVYSLHACDTATDKALHFGLRNNARCILSVSCCQHTMKKTMRGGDFTGMTRHRVLKDRLVYLVGDSMRALLLEMMGFKVDLIDFVSTRHTDKNIMLRAEKSQVRNRKELAREYAQLKRAFHMTPALERYILGDEIVLPEVRGLNGSRGHDEGVEEAMSQGLA